MISTSFLIVLYSWVDGTLYYFLLLQPEAAAKRKERKVLWVKKKTVKIDKQVLGAMGVAKAANVFKEKKKKKKKKKGEDDNVEGVISQIPDGEAIEDGAKVPPAVENGAVVEGAVVSTAQEVCRKYKM